MHGSVSRSHYFTKVSRAYGSLTTATWLEDTVLTPATMGDAFAKPFSIMIFPIMFVKTPVDLLK